MNTSENFASQYAVQPIRLVIAGQNESDLRTLRALASETRWEIFEVRNNIGARAAVLSRQPGVILAEHDVVTSSWVRLLDEIHEMPCPPRVIVFSRWSDARLSAEVLNRGGYDVLAVPFDREEVLHAVGLAWESWNNAHTPVASVNNALPPSRRKPPEVDERRTPFSELFLARRG